MDSETKLREMILFAARAFQADMPWSATRLRRALFHTDFRAWRTLGRPVSDRVYWKTDQGPTPEGMVSAISGMEREGFCSWRDERLLVHREADLSVFTPEEIVLLRSVIEDLRSLEPEEAGDFSDGFFGWLAARDGEEIPYGTAFMGRPRPLTPEEVDWAHEAIDEYLERALPPNRQRAAV
ncbi:MAG TPA: hypothetical protein VLQ45_07970 [Thermoanaerobaculia bacterium]|nr:hypothetical protein [Thermoanaerobaculia bacterium]HSN89499.1 hypothetical protein [Thermoanaerobaculia bacterium]